MKQTPGFVLGNKQKNILKYYLGRPLKKLITGKNIEYYGEEKKTLLSIFPLKS